MIALFLISFALLAKLRVLMLSLILSEEGLTLATIIVLLLPPRESRNKKVIFEFL